MDHVRGFQSMYQISMVYTRVVVDAEEKNTRGGGGGGGFKTTEK